MTTSVLKQRENVIGNDVFILNSLSLAYLVQHGLCFVCSIIQSPKHILSSICFPFRVGDAVLVMLSPRLRTLSDQYRC